MKGIETMKEPLEIMDRSIAGVPVAVVLRHAHCPPVRPGSFGNEVSISSQGAHEARILGERLRAQRLTALVSSPLPRCMQTAMCLAEGAEWAQYPTPNRLLGHPGAFVADAEQAGPCFLKHGPEKVVRRLLEGELLPGLRRIAEGVALLIGLILPEDMSTDGVRVFVTHDTVLAPLVLHLPSRFPGPGD